MLFLGHVLRPWKTSSVMDTASSQTKGDYDVVPSLLRFRLGFDRSPSPNHSTHHSLASLVGRRVKQRGLGAFLARNGAASVAGTINRQQLDLRKLGAIPIKNLVKLPCRGIGVDSDTTWNELHTSAAARLAVGCTLDLAFKGRTRPVRR